MVYKVLHKLVFIPPNKIFFELASNESQRTRGHLWKIYHKRVETNLANHYWSHRVVDYWNVLEPDTVCAATLKLFKIHLNNDKGKIIDLFMKKYPTIMD